MNLFIAWYDDQSQGGVHSPEICLPSAGWEIAWLERTDVAEAMQIETPFNINRAIIQKGEARMMVYYWFEQKGRRIAWDFAAKFWLVVDGIRTGRTRRRARPPHDRDRRKRDGRAGGGTAPVDDAGPDAAPCRATSRPGPEPACAHGMGTSLTKCGT